VASGEKPEQMTSDNFNNVSPHLSPDGHFLLILSYSKDLKGIAENKDVTLRMMSLADKSVKVLAEFVGGQGSLGTQPWSPDGRRVVFISYQAMELLLKN
jgi:Tol biopolymer transport system component